MKENKELLEAIKIYNDLAKTEIVKSYSNALSTIFKFIDSEKNKPKEEYIKSSNKWDYYLRLPYEKLDWINSYEYGFVQKDYDVIGKGIAENKGHTLYFCSKYETKEKAIEDIDKHIEEDNLESQV